MKIIIFRPSSLGEACGVKDHSLELLRQATQQGWTTNIYEFFHDTYPNLNILPKSGEVLVILQFVFFGLHKYGIPWRLVDFCNHIRARPNIKLVVYFHELPQVSGNRLVASFRAYMQWTIASCVGRNADAVVVNQIEEELRLKDRYGRSPFFLPTFSNVGELESFNAMSVRHYDLVVFGTPGRRRRAYEKLGNLTEHCIGGRIIQLIADVGPPIELPEFLESNILIQKYGMCSNKRVSEILADSWAGLFSAPPKQATKSGILAAYCAHGVLPINVEEPISGLPHTDLVPFIYLNGERVDRLEAERIRRHAFDWSRQYPMNEAMVKIVNAAYFSF
jgi:hypothetical protein